MKRLISMTLALCIICTLLPTAAVAAEAEPRADRQLSEGVTGGGAAAGGQFILIEPEVEAPEPPRPMLFGLDIEIPVETETVRNIEYDNQANAVCINNNPVVIKEDPADNLTYFYDADGNKLTIYDTDGAVYGTQNIDGKTIYGGSRQFEDESGNTDIRMESGTVGFIYGGDVYSTRTGNTSVVITGGTVIGVWGGSYGDNSGRGKIIGNTYVEISGTAVCAQVYGGGYVYGSLVTGTSTVVVKDTAEVTQQLSGGAWAGEVGNVSLTVGQGATGGTLLAAGVDTFAVTKDVTVDFNGTFERVAGGGRGTAGHVDMTIGSGASISQFLCAAGSDSGSVTESTHLILNGGTVKNNNNDGYIYGGGIGGSVTGNVTIDINKKQASGWPYVRGGGETAEATVDGNVTINCNSHYAGGITVGGYEGEVKGKGKLTLTRVDDTANIPVTYYLNGSGISAPVTGGSELILKDANLELNSFMGNFQKIELQKATLQPRTGTDEQQVFRNLAMDADSVLKLNGKSLAVSGNFEGNGTIQISVGESFSVGGTTSGVSGLILKPAVTDPNVALPDSVKMVSGASAAAENYTMKEPADRVLNKKSDGLYAEKNNAAAQLSITAPDTAVYGDALSVSVTAQTAGTLPSDAKLRLRVYSAKSLPPIYEKEVSLNSDKTAVFSDLPLLEVSNYSLNAALVKGDLNLGSAGTSIQITKRPLTLKSGTYSAYTRGYIKNNTDIKLPEDFFSGAVLEGYYGTDSGGKLANAVMLYRMENDSAGQNKKNTCAATAMVLDTNSGPEDAGIPENQKPLYIMENYTVVPPAMTIHITPSAVTDVGFPHTTANMRVGAILKDTNLTGGAVNGTFAWKTPNAIIAMGKNNHDMVFTPADTHNLDYSNLAGWDGNTKTITRSVEVTGVKKEDVTPFISAHTYGIWGAAQNIELTLADLCKMPDDAGSITYAHNTFGSSVSQLTNVAVANGKLTFTIPENAVEGKDSIGIKIVSDVYEDSLLTVQISLTEKTAVQISGVQIDNLDANGFRTYTGKGATYSGSPVLTGGYTGELEYIWRDKSGQELAQAPVTPERYELLIRVPTDDENYAGEAVLSFNIVRAPLAVKAKSYTVEQGADAPAYKVDISGLVEGDAATTTASCNYRKGNPVGSYTIMPSSHLIFTNGVASNYQVKPENGVLTVQSPSSGSNDDDDNSSTTPALPSVGEVQGWSAVQGKLSTAPSGATVTVFMNGTTELPVKTLETIAGKDITLALDMGGGATWVIHGKDVPASGLSALKLGVSTNTANIPVSVLNSLTGQKAVKQLSLSHNGAFGIALVLRLETGKENAGLWANLYYYNSTSKKLELQATSLIGTDGKADLPFAHASDYAVVIDSKNHSTMPFTDVAKDAWYYSHVAQAYEKGLFSGTSATTFSPNLAMSRAMLWTTLARMEGKDVSSGASWYESAQIWATGLGITDGTNPGADMSREQLAAMLYRHAGSPVTTEKLSGFADSTQVSQWATNAMQWAVAQGILAGKDGSRLDPGGVATRAEVAAMLVRYTTVIGKSK